MFRTKGRANRPFAFPGKRSEGVSGSRIFAASNSAAGIPLKRKKTPPFPDNEGIEGLIRKRGLLAELIFVVVEEPFDQACFERIVFNEKDCSASSIHEVFSHTHPEGEVVMRENSQLEGNYGLAKP